jgi:hypothetical protein
MLFIQEINFWQLEAKYIFEARNPERIPSFIVMYITMSQFIENTT